MPSIMTPFPSWGIGSPGAGTPPPTMAPHTAPSRPSTAPLAGRSWPAHDPAPRDHHRGPGHSGLAPRARHAHLERFVAGYFDAFEWLLPDSEETDWGIDRGKIRGWSADAKKRIRRDCRDFWRANRKALATYVEVTERDYDHGGHDFYLTREGHGAGFWARGHHPVLTELTKASEAAGPAGDVFLDRGWLRID
jgi:hypothetical protein